MSGQLVPVTVNDVAIWRELSIETFNENFGKFTPDHQLQAYFDSAYSLETLTADILSPETDVQFIYYQGELAGYIKLNVGSAQSDLQADDNIEVQRLYLKRAYKRFGLGRQLLAYAMTHGQQLGKAYIWLGVWENNHAAMPFYQALGFEVFGEHAFDVGGDRQRDLLMKRLLVH